MAKILTIFSILLFSFGSFADSMLVLSDIHFDPLAQKGLVGKLIEQPATKWKEIFQKGASKKLSSYRHDTNYALWSSALSAMQKETPNPAVVLVAGDFFRHTFRAEFESIYRERKGDPKKLNEAFVEFQGKTIRFLAGELVERFPDAQFIPVIGNNESSCGDYKVFLRDPLLREFVSAWRSVSDQSIPAESAQEFATSGHYTTALKSNSKIRFIVANDIFMAAEYNGRCGNSMVPPALGELEWMNRQLAAAEKNQEKVWLITHVPPGINVLRSLSMFKDDYTQKYVDLLRKYAKTIQYNVTGHSHFADFRLGGNVAILIAPSISADKSNNPAFQIYDVNASGTVTNIAQYSLDLTAAKPIWTKLLDFDKTFHEKEITAASLKELAENLKNGKYTGSYIEMATSRAALATAVMKMASKASVCAITEMTTDPFKACVKQ
jgi:sphingomyelin phosphodiesterase acid-like 3